MMKLWRGGFLQVRSGPQPSEVLFGDPPPDRTPSSISKVLEAALHTDVEAHGKIWRASLRSASNDWTIGLIGRAPRDPDEDEWRPATGWELDASRSKHAAIFAIHHASNTILLERHSQVSPRGPRQAFRQLQKILNETLDDSFPPCGWVVRIVPDEDHTPFIERFEAMSTVTFVRATMSVPNARAHDLINDALGMAGDADAEDVTIELSGTHGVDRNSDIVRSFIALLRKGLARLRVSGRETADADRSVSIRSDSEATPKRFEAPGEHLEAASADVALEAIGEWEDRDTDPL